MSRDPITTIWTNMTSAQQERWKRYSLEVVNCTREAMSLEFMIAVQNDEDMPAADRPGLEPVASNDMQQGVEDQLNKDIDRLVNRLRLYSPIFRDFNRKQIDAVIQDHIDN